MEWVLVKNINWNLLEMIELIFGLKNGMEFIKKDWLNFIWLDEMGFNKKDWLDFILKYLKDFERKYTL